MSHFFRAFDSVVTLARGALVSDPWIVGAVAELSWYPCRLTSLT
jgi:hypothetical protein